MDTVWKSLERNAVAWEAQGSSLGRLSQSIEPVGEGAVLKSLGTEVKQKQRERSWGKSLGMEGAPCVQEILENGSWWGKESGRLVPNHATPG